MRGEKKMKLVWLVIVGATAAMFLIAATLLAKPYEQGGRSFYKKTGWPFPEWHAGVVAA